jgi:hypothetical protein
MISVGLASGEYPLENALPVDLDKVPWSSDGVSAIASFDRSGHLLFSSYYGELPTSLFRYDPTGHIVTNGKDAWKSWSNPGRKQMRTYNAFQPVYSGTEFAGNLILNRQYLPLCGEDAVSCSFTVPDTIWRDSTRNYISVQEFPLDVTITNPDPTRPVFDLSCELRLPPGLVVVPDTAPLSVDVVPMLAPGASADLHWMLRLRTASIRDSLLAVTVVTRYRWADLLDNCLYSYGGCRAEIVYLRRDTRDLELECDLLAPDSVALDASGDWYTTDRVPVTMRLRNAGPDPVLPGEAALRVGAPGVWIEPAADSLRALGALRPGGEIDVPWQLRIERRGYDRDMELRAEVRDALGLLPAECKTVLHVPGIPALRCALTAPERIVGTEAAGFPSFNVQLRLENHIDTLVRRVEAAIDLSSAPHLRLPAGTSARQLLGPIANGAVRIGSWPVEVSTQAPDTTRQWIVVWYWYQEDTTRRSCEVAVDLLRPGEGMSCLISGPTVIVAADTLLHPSPIVLDYQFHNSGSQPITVDRFALDVMPGNGLIVLDNPVLPGGLIAPGGVMPHSWRLRPFARPAPFRETVRIRAFGAGDTVLSECTHIIDIAGIDGLRCAITAPDSVRFDRDSSRYVPDPVMVTMDLSNVLDLAESDVEVTLDLSLAPRLRLAPGEARRKTLAVIDSHGRGRFSWLLIPQRGTSNERQIIRVQYASATPGPWKQCETETVITAWPEIAEVRCATAGHDSIFADAAYEAIVPEPFQVSYTATNSGTIALSGCQAAIILPPGFALAGADSIQSFGDDPPGKLTPGGSATRWWTVTTTDQLQGFGANDITWQWTSDQQGSSTGCTHTVQVVPDPSSGIVLTPLRLYFEAELGGALPAAQTVKLWTGGGLSMPWTAQSDGWYIDIDPVAGDQAGSIAVQPNTTMLNKGLHASTITVGGSAVNLPKNIAVDYLITSLTEVEEQPSARALSLGPVYPHPIPLAGEARILVRNPQGQPLRVTLHDLLGRERALLREGVTTDSDVLYLRPATLGLSPGSYLLRVLSPEGQQSRMVTIMR